MFRKVSTLQSYLHSHGLTTATWGTQGTKTLTHLLHELQKGESSLKEVHGQLLRFVLGIGINVCYQTDNEVLKLTEDRQVFHNQPPRQRTLSTSLGEKMLPNELPKATAHRALQEELGITGYEFAEPRIEDRQPKVSGTYPGLLTKHYVYVFDIYLRKEDYRQEGYMEVQPDKTTYFIWKKTT